MVSRLSPHRQSFWSRSWSRLARRSNSVSSFGTYALNFNARMGIGLTRFHRQLRLIALTRGKGFTVSKAIRKALNTSRYRSVATQSSLSLPLPDRLRCSYHKYTNCIKLLPSIYLAQCSSKLGVLSKYLLVANSSGFTTKAVVNGSANAAQFSILNLVH